MFMMLRRFVCMYLLTKLLSFIVSSAHMTLLRSTTLNDFAVLTTSVRKHSALVTSIPKRPCEMTGIRAL